jgi:hypothetical protein
MRVPFERDETFQAETRHQSPPIAPLGDVRRDKDGQPIPKRPNDKRFLD